MTHEMLIALVRIAADYVVGADNLAGALNARTDVLEFRISPTGD
jgi:hypothetical protein